MAAKKTAKIQSFQGLISAPFTAFTPDGEVNAEVIPKYVDHLVKQGVKGVFVNGTTGEGLSLTVSERKAIANEWVKHGKDKLELVIIHIGANSMKDAQELASHAEKIGATGIASLPPLFYKPQTLDHLVEYFKKIAEAAPTLPLMLYHIPSYSGVEVCLGEFLPKVRNAVPTFCGAKFTSTEVRDLLRCHALPGEPFKILSGFDEVLLPCLASGVTAAVGASYNFMAPLTLRVLEAFKNGNIEEARKHQARAVMRHLIMTQSSCSCVAAACSFQLRLHITPEWMENRILHALEKICSHGQGIACLKATMNIVGSLDFGPPRVPLVPLDSKSLENLQKDLKELKTEEWSTI